MILCNLPYHAGFDVPKRLIERAFRHLALGGRLMLVVKRRLWYEKKLCAVFGGVHINERDGYFIMTAEKRSVAHPAKPAKTPTKKHRKRLERRS